MGSLCCVAARPHGASVTSREWSSIGRNEPFWQNNSSFSPPLSSRWFHSEGLSYGTHGDGSGVAQYGSSLSSNSKRSRSWGQSDLVGDNHSSDSVASFISSPSDSDRNNQLILPPMLEVNVEGSVGEPSPGPLTFSQFLEGTFGVSSWAGSTSSRSDGSDSELISKPHGTSNFSFSNRRFMSKPVHPLTFPEQAAGDGGTYCFVGSSNSNSSFSDYRSNQALSEPQSLGFSKTSTHSHRRSAQWSSTSSVDFIDLSGTLEPETVASYHATIFEGSKCELCDRLLSKRSPWGSRRIVHSADMPIISVLSCRHVYHAECLERTIPKAHKHDPQCPVCEKPDGNSAEQWAVCKLKKEFSRMRSTGGEGSSKVWSCAKVGDFVEGALHAPKQSRMVLLNRSRLRRQLSMKEGLVEQAESSKKVGFCSLDAFGGPVIGGEHAVGCSSMTSSSGLKRR